jgi:hypothetical protein
MIPNLDIMSDADFFGERVPLDAFDLGDDSLGDSLGDSTDALGDSLGDSTDALGDSLDDSTDALGDSLGDALACFRVERVWRRCFRSIIIVVI